MSGVVSLLDRAGRYLPARPLLAFAEEGPLGQVQDISRSGMACGSVDGMVVCGQELQSLRVQTPEGEIDLGAGSVVRAWTETHEGAPETHHLAVRFEQDQSEPIRRLADALKPPTYASDEPENILRLSPIDARDHSLDEFHETSEPDLFAKCRSFGHWVDDLLSKGVYQRLYRVTATSGLDHRITIVDAARKQERSMRCFDSNSYLGLHLHPKVVEACAATLQRVGLGTSSAQLLAGTNRYLRELEDALSEFHGRESTIVFPTGYAANLGAIQGLLRKDDAVIRDRYAHASIHEGCRASAARYNKIFGHSNPQSLDKLLARATSSGCKGKLVITDGVFSMHGEVAPLPELMAVCRKHGARMMIDDAHGVGVIGARGGGVEEHFDMVGEVDVLMGTLSKALGGLGGYVTGHRELIHYLRWFAPSGLFTTSLPAHVCAGLTESLRIVREEPQHRERLWRNIRYLRPLLKDAGFVVSQPESPIMTVLVGAQERMWQMSCELFEAGIKCGSVMYPAVGKRECILRILLNANHTQEDLDYLVENMVRLGRKYDVLGRTAEELTSAPKGGANKRAPVGLTGS